HALAFPEDPRAHRRPDQLRGLPVRTRAWVGRLHSRGLLRLLDRELHQLDGDEVVVDPAVASGAGTVLALAVPEDDEIELRDRRDRCPRLAARGELVEAEHRHRVDAEGIAPSEHARAGPAFAIAGPGGT